MPTKINNNNYNYNYTLERIYNQREINLSRTHNASSWKGCLPTHDYVVRERVLGLCSQTKDLWVYKLTQDEVTLSTIEVLVRPSWKVVSGKLVDTKCACIGGVYVLPENRGKGLAKVMVDLVLSELESVVDYTFLYSEIGDYYCKSGFESMEVKLVKWEGNHLNHSKNDLNGLNNGLENGKYLNNLENGNGNGNDLPVPMNGDCTSNGNHSINGHGGDQNNKTTMSQSPELITDSDGFTIEELKFMDFSTLMNQYNHQTQGKLQGQSLSPGANAPDSTPASFVSINPSANALDWFHLRSKYIEYLLFNKKKYDFEHATYQDIISTLKSYGNQTFGLKVSHDSDSGFIVWTQDWNGSQESYLTILKIVVLKGDYTKVTKKLLTTFNKFISQWNISKITLWESEISPEIKSFLVNSYDAITDIENGSRSAILMNNPQDHQKLLTGELIWAGNDKLPWF